MFSRDLGLSHSGLRFVNGRSLGLCAAPTAQGVLAEEFEEQQVEYVKLRRRWLAMVQEYSAAAADAVLPEEQAFWKSMADRLESWRKAEDFRTLFRLCECGKIGGIVCRNVGRWRPSAPSALRQEDDVEACRDLQEEEARPVESIPEDLDWAALLADVEQKETAIMGQAARRRATTRPSRKRNYE